MKESIKEIFGFIGIIIVILVGIFMILSFLKVI